MCSSTSGHPPAERWNEEYVCKLPYPLTLYWLVCLRFVFVFRIMRPPRRPAGMKQICILNVPCYIDNARFRATASEFNESGDDMPKKKIKRRAWSSADVRKFKSLAKAK